MDKYNELLNGLAETLQLESIDIDENNEACLLFDDSLLILFKLDEVRNEIILKSKIGFINDEKKTSVYEKLLEANLFWNETAGATFALEDDFVILSSRLLLANLDKNRFETEVETFVNVTEYWLENINTIQKESPQDDQGANSAVPNFIRA